jgi:glycosyl transferase family 87
MGAANSEWFRHRDFSSLYYGAHLVTQIDVYDDVDWCREARGTTFGAVDANGEPLCPAVYLYPLWTAVVLLPLGLLPLEAAGALWVAISIAATLAGARWCWYAVDGRPRAAPLFIALVVSSEPFWLMLAGGQIGGILTLGVGLGAWLLSRRREGSAGATLAILALKPHVLGLEALALLVRAVATRSRAFLAGAFGAVGALLVISLPFRWSWPFEWLHESFGRQTGYSPSLATAWGFAAHDLGNILFAPLVIAVVVVAALMLARGIPRDPVTFTALAVPLSLFAGPYAWSYDFVVLALPWAFVLARADRAEPAVRRAFVITLALVASLLAWGLYGLAFTRGAETLSAWIPALSALLVAAALRVPSRT